MIHTQNATETHKKNKRKTGLDRRFTKLRPVEGLAAGDYLIPKYWVFARLFANLAAVGYDTNNLHFAGYDWRYVSRLCLVCVSLAISLPDSTAFSFSCLCQTNPHTSTPSTLSST